MKFTPGVIGTGFSGSVGGVTASRNPSGAYIKAKPNPVNPNSPRQQAVRSAFQLLTEAWSSDLTQAQRDAWQVYANTITFTDGLGTDYKISGMNMYVRSNLNRVSAGVAIVDDGPVVLTLPGVDNTVSAAISEATQLISVSFDDTLDYIDEDEAAMQVSMSLPRSPGRFFIGGPFRVAGAILGDSITPLTSPQTFAAPFPIAAGQKVELEYRITRADGRVSNPFRSQSTVIA